MRTTVSLDSDVAAAVKQLRRTGMGLSEAVNELVRRGLAATDQRRRFKQRTHRIGMRIDVTNVGEALDLLEN